MTVISDFPTEQEALLEYLSANQLGDGLPVVPPTEARVDQMIEATSRDPESVLIDLPTSFEPLSIRALGQCAVMAGCKPAYFPALIAAFDGMAEWENLRAAIATTSGFAILTVLNGPVRDAWDVNTDTGLFGPGYRANATIGRSVSLAFLVVGEAFPGTGTMATHTHPGRYLYCFGENEEASAWQPLHVSRGGLDRDSSAVTVAPAQAPKPVSEGSRTAPEELLDTFVDGVEAATATAIPSGDVIVVLSKDHAGRLGEHYAKDEVQAYITDRATSTNGEPVITSRDEVIVVVAGGIGNYSSVLPTWREGTPPTTVPIAE